MSQRFYCPDLTNGPTARLEGPEAHHLARVLRKSVGDEVELFDGKGRSASAEVMAISKKAAEFKLLELKESPAPVSEIVLASAVPKGDRFRWLIEKATELGVDRFIPLVTQRSVVQPGEGKHEKMEQAVIEASKQCGRNWLMGLAEPCSLAAVLEMDHPKCQIKLIAHPSGKPLKQAFPADAVGSVLILIGPEGGWTAEEVEKATGAGCELIGLGENILRIETAGLAMAAYASVWCGDVG